MEDEYFARKQMVFKMHGCVLMVQQKYREDVKAYTLGSNQ